MAQARLTFTTEFISKSTQEYTMRLVLGRRILSGASFFGFLRAARKEAAINDQAPRWSFDQRVI